MAGKSLIPEGTKIETWYNETMQIDEIRDLDAELRKSLEDYKNAKKSQLFNDI